MNKLLITVMLFAASLVALDADAARRLGGARSTGKQSQNVQRDAPAAQKTDVAKPAAPAAATPAAAAPAAIPPKPASAWKGMLGGALLGLGLGALLSNLGIGGAMASFISTMLMLGLFGLAAYFIYRLVTRKSGAAAPQAAYAGGYSPQAADSPPPSPANSSTPFRVPEIGSGIGVQRTDPVMSPAQPDAAANAATWSVPADFDVPAFLRSAKSYFIRLQAAWDKGDSADLRDFTTPEMFGELKLQLHERGAAASMTDVVTLDAELLGIEVIGNEHLASVRFTGTIKESAQAPAEAFIEVWNISKPAGGKDGWLLAGIQQVS